MSEAEVTAEVRRLALQILEWEDLTHYAFAWKNERILFASRIEGGFGQVFEVDLVARTKRYVGGSGERYLGL